MNKILNIHIPPVTYMGDFVEITILGNIPDFLKKSISLKDNKIVLDNVEGFKLAPCGSVIGYETTNYTDSGYNCWSIGKIGVDLEKLDDRIYMTKEKTIVAMPIPTPYEEIPMWVKDCHLIYNGDGTVTLETGKGNVIGRIGLDFILCHGLKPNGTTEVSILTPEDDLYYNYVVCDASGADIARLCELYPAYGGASTED